MSIKDAAIYIRDNLARAVKKGYLKKEHCESHLLEIREYNLRVDKYKNETVKKIEEAFRGIINSLKQRKEEIISELIERFSEEKEKIVSQEKAWNDKQLISEKILGLMNDNDDKNIILNSSFIMEGLNMLNERLEFKEIKICNDIDTSLYIDRNNYPNQTGNLLVLNQADIENLLLTYMTIGEPNILEYKA